MRRKVVSIFSGIDCMGLGASKNFDIILAVEKEKSACDTLIHNRAVFHPNLEVWNKDVTSISDEEILEFKGTDGIIGGPPCQAFSSAIGSFNPDDIRIKLIFEYLRWVKLIEPNFFIFENVKGLLDKNKIGIFETFLANAESLGYDISYKLLNSHDYGNAQSRDRVIVVGFKNSLNIKFNFPEPVSNKKYVRDILDTDVTGEYVNARPKIQALMPFVPEGGNWRDLKTEELKQQALGVSYYNRNGGMTGTCRRLHRDKPCPTLVTSPVQNKTLLYHPTENRPLSITEYRRAQGIPENYTIIGSLSSQYMFVGNGVPVEMSYEVSKAVLKALNSI